MPKVTTPRSVRQRQHNPLEHDILATGILRNKAPKRKHTDEADEADGFVSATSTKKILQLGRELVEEDQESGPVAQKPTAFDFGSRWEHEETEEGGLFDDEAEGQWADEDDQVEEIEIDADDLATFNRFLPSALDQDPLLTRGWDGGISGNDAAEDEPGVNLADVILAKIAAHEASMDKRPEVAPEEDYQFPPKVVEVYSKIGNLMQRYKSGKLPKPVKILPTVPHWESLLEYLMPDLWTPNAILELTKIFASSRPVAAQRWLELVVLDRVREDIRETKRLNVHLFAALKKSFYKPSAFFKGILFPLVGSGTCTLREAHIIAGVLTRVSIPVLHSAAALKGLCDIAAQEALARTEAGNATNFFIKTLLEKKYALPYQAIDSLVFHFLRYRVVESTAPGGRAQGITLPVIWHQCLLVFAQRYKNDISEDQREALLDLLLTHDHPSISPETRRELLAGRGRGVPKEPAALVFDGDDTMQIDT